MVAKVLKRADAGAEPQLAAGERGHHGTGAGAGVERVGPRGRSAAKLRAGLRGLQQAEGRSDAQAGPDAAPQAADPAGLETAVRRARHADRQLVEVRERSVLERNAARVGPACRAGPRWVPSAGRDGDRRYSEVLSGRQDLCLQGCAPGRADGLQSHPTGFEILALLSFVSMVQRIASDPPKVRIQVRVLVETLALQVYQIARQTTICQDEVRFLGRAIEGAKWSLLPCAGEGT